MLSILKRYVWLKYYVKTQFELSRLYRFTGKKTQKLTVNVRQLQFFSLAEFLLQASGNKVSRQSVLCGSQNIVINGKVRYSWVVEFTSLLQYTC